MKHSREDYNRIQDPKGIIPEDEPVFLLRAQDEMAPVVVWMWAELYEQTGGDKELIELAKISACNMIKWQVLYGRKTADLVSKPREIPKGFLRYPEQDEKLLNGKLSKIAMDIASRNPCLR